MVFVGAVINYVTDFAFNPPPAIVLPTKTTCTLANAAVAAKISTLLALVNNARQTENRALYANSTSSRSTGCWMKYSVKMDAAGMTDASMTPTRCETARRCSLR